MLMAWEEDSNLRETSRGFRGAVAPAASFVACVSRSRNDGAQIFASSLEEGLLRSLRLLLGEERGELGARAGVGELGGRLGGAAAVLHVQILHEQHLVKAKGVVK